MTSSSKIQHINTITGGFQRSAYSIFDASREKDITLWQPGTKVDDIKSLPKPRISKERAQSFLQQASGSDLAVAPEWAYDVEWVFDHERLFDAGSPLFVLGCRPVNIEEMQATVDKLEEEFHVIGEDVPDDAGKEFVTPTIVPLRPDAVSNPEDRTIVIQYKNCPMSEGANPNEADNLATGNQIYHFGPTVGVGVLVWTCSDLLDDDLKEEVVTHTREGNILVQPQCNPKPFHREWTRFRERIFANRNDVTYICANWGIPPKEDSNDGQWGYSGVYAKARDWSSLDNYTDTYNNGGVQGVSPFNHAEYVWTLVDDGVSTARVRREGNGSAPNQGDRAEPQILSTQTWGGSMYNSQAERLDQCVCEACDECDCQTCSYCKVEERRTELPDSPRDAELLAAVTLWRIKIDEMGSLEDRYDVPLAALETLRANEREQLEHSFVAHGHRKGNSVAENTRRVIKTFELASSQYTCSIKPADQCEPLDIPINATESGEDGIDISLSRLDIPTPGKRRKRLVEIVKLWNRQDNRKFKPLSLMVSSGEEELKEVDGLEDVTKGDLEPEEVTASSSSVNFVEVDQ